MKLQGGLWIDHREAVIVLIDGTQLRMRKVASRARRRRGMERGMHAPRAYGAHSVSSDDIRAREFEGQLASYYDEVISVIRHMNEVVVLGPGEARNEFKKRMERAQLGSLITEVSACDRLTRRQLAARVRAHFA